MLTAATASVAAALSLVYIQTMITHEFDPALTVFAVLELGAAALVAGTRWRPTPLLVALLGVFVIVGNWGPIAHDLMHPEAYVLFRFIVVAVAFAVLMIGAGVAATVQNYRAAPAARHTPRALPAALSGLVMLAVGALLVGAIPHPAAAGVSPELLAGLPALTTPGFSFSMPTITVKAGETVAYRLDNPTQVPHSLDIDELNVHAAMAPSGSGLALFKPTTPGTYTFYCSLPGHRELGMEGTLVVEP
jgi:uncharacterized cupredoxin-like copper-binding protein